MDINTKSVDTLRVLSAEMIQRAGSGHPGLALGSAPIAYTLFADFLKFNPDYPDWDNRDRFILSAGHGSALLYSLLHLFGYGVSMEDLKSFRHSEKCPGHPERGHTPGVEITTGPLGQGIANAVGMAAAEAHLASLFNREGYPVVDHFTYALCSDGCLEEGISYEACSWAGTQKLGKLILLYDDNDITIEGDRHVTFTENTAMRFISQGWQVLRVPDATDLGYLRRAIYTAKQERERPTLIICKTVIGHGSDDAGTAKVHGAPLGEEGVKALRRNLGYDFPPFEIPEDVSENARRISENRKIAWKEWQDLFTGYESEYPSLAAKYRAYFSGETDTDELKKTADGMKFEKSDATRNTGHRVINEFAKAVPNFFGGAADLAPSTRCNIEDSGYFSPDDREGCNIHFGIREHAMGAMANGIAAHGGLRAFGSTFFVFCDYMKHSMRLAALMGLPVTYILTHDSIGVGEDGATHQPVEQIEMLRSIPGMYVYRPADGKETAYSYLSALTGSHPSAMILSRQNLPQYETSGRDALKGGYVLSDCTGKADVILIGTGSEVSLCMDAKKILEGDGVKTRVVSMPCMELFEDQPQEYRDSVLPPDIRMRVCVEAASTPTWYRYAKDGIVLGVDGFGISDSPDRIYEKFGLTAENIAAEAEKLIIG